MQHCYLQFLNDNEFEFPKILHPSLGITVVYTYIEGYAKKTERTFCFIASFLVKIMLLLVYVLKDDTLRILKW